MANEKPFEVGERVVLRTRYFYSLDWMVTVTRVTATQALITIRNIEHRFNRLTGRGIGDDAGDRIQRVSKEEAERIEHNLQYDINCRTLAGTNWKKVDSDTVQQIVDILKEPHKTKDL